ncbi:uncharacterized protein LOC125034240 [Penaeus chinensis]|uniref:uncharacterized protein LOC125034240 n=1 Tax=Penaeus chinensis TaxID=139456 RepID=UPI001FB79F1F|nr:uncharacterized protein LOC125034240 [Penaeus chinensis]XP_047481911.1 uncharacterized protein LOC125034240 [Penaeus chinensis]XP_047481912.1 uncharacterized protein LOC125034240 [Penaeus chinensis]XP_047481913.1 uncharacterized protein LOC125034240 [Penaeus chinensis]XP_047481914.1 uncharacterized protein LOC125034240 [Penaeus chinensis]XP_047481915.1 uncharacterized protein LOC125034240 [Penaeus chinensis]
MPPVKTQNKSKKKSTLPAKVGKHKKLTKKELTTPKSQKVKRDYNEKKKKKSESEVKKQKKKKIKFPFKPVKAAKERKKVVEKKNSKSLAKKQKMKSPDLKGKITISKRKRQNSESEVQVKMKKKRKINSPFNSSQITKPKQPVKMKRKMPLTETKDLYYMEMDEMGTTKQRYVTCFSCHVLVPEKDFHSHLFFGRMKCRFCLNPVQKCTDFANQILKPNGYCSKSPTNVHGILQWDSCLQYVLLTMKNEITIRNVCNDIKVEPNEFEICCEISKYMKSLESLEQVDPWKSAFQELKAYCEKVLSQLKPPNCCILKLFKGNERKGDDKFIALSNLCGEKKTIIKTKNPDSNISLEASGDLVAPEKKVFSQQSQGIECATVSELQSSYVCANITGTSDINKTESNEIKSIKQEEDLIKRRNHHQKFKKRDLKKIVKLPKDGRYLLVHYPNEQCPEECPECYSGFYPSNVTLYCTTPITKVVCEVCGLVIFIVPGFYDARN